MTIASWRVDSGVSWFSLLASTGTLICCALPILLVTVGLGATVVALTSSFPVLVALSSHKEWIFAGSGVLLALAGWLMYRPGRTCPQDPQLARLCLRSQKWNRRVYWSSAAVWAIGFFAAYLLLPLRMALEG
jgi:type IV secretory pathway TrbD component